MVKCDVEMENKIRQETGLKSPSRVARLITKFIADLNLDLSGLVVLTEAASGNYIVTPIIAAMAGAKEVNAVTKDSKYGRAKDIEDNTLLFASYVGIGKKINIYSHLKKDVIKKADIITNLGFVRPIDKSFIQNLKPTAVISLMYETSEFREQDLDLRECWKKGIAVLGTNENHKTLNVFDYVGHLCMKKLYELEVEVFNSKIVLVGEWFQNCVVRTLSAAGAEVLCVTGENKKKIDGLGGRKIGQRLNQSTVRNKIKDCDAIIISTYPSSDFVIGESGYISAEEIRRLAPGSCVIQLAGYVDRDSLSKCGIHYSPKDVPAVGHMAFTLADLGPKPVIALHCGGLRVGELLARARLLGLDRKGAEHEALANSICQDFSPVLRRKYA